MDIAYIEWEDHCQVVSETGGAWIDASDLPNKPSVIKSVGYVVKEDEKYVTIASCRDASEEDNTAFKGVSVIIKSCIVNRKGLSV